MAGTKVPTAPRAQVVKVRTDRCLDYEGALLGGGCTASSGTYTINTNALDPNPRPTVDLSVYADRDDTVLGTELVQAVFRDAGATLWDDAAQSTYLLYRFYVLVSLEVPREGGGYVNSFQWAADPEAAALAPPYDTAAGVYGFDFASGWTSVPV